MDKDLILMLLSLFLLTEELKALIKFMDLIVLKITLQMNLLLTDELMMPESTSAFQGLLGKESCQSSFLYVYCE